MKDAKYIKWFLVSLVIVILTACGGGSGSSGSSEDSGDSGDITVEVEYRNEYFNNDGYFNAVTHSVSQTTASLVQAIYAINTFLYTDPKITPYETFYQRKVAVDKALDVLMTSAEATLLYAENADYYHNKYIREKILTPEEVYAITNSGHPMRQIATLMNELNVNAKTAKKILDDAMTELSTNYQNEAAWYDTAARTSEVIKNTAGLALVVGGTLISGGATVIGESVVLGAADMGILLITGLDASIKVSKSVVELGVSQDINISGSNIGYVAYAASVFSEVVGIKEFIKKPNDIMTLINRSRDLLQDKKINFGPESITISDDMHALLLAISKNPILFSAFVGSYLMPDGSKINIDKIDKTIKELLEKLDNTNKIDEVKKSRLIVTHIKKFKMVNVLIKHV